MKINQQQLLLFGKQKSLRRAGMIDNEKTPNVENGILRCLAKNKEKRETYC